MSGLRIVLIIFLVSFSFTMMVFASEDEGHHEWHKDEVYGIVDKIPDGRLGTWIINGKEVLVTEGTIINEEHGKAKVGAYVEVKGMCNGKILNAFKIEIKRD